MTFLGEWFFRKVLFDSSQIKYGVSFSPRYARYLKLDWKKVYIQMLDDLRVRNLRLATYWSSLQPENAQMYDFSDTDFMISEAEKRNAQIVLVVGIKQPRWPECHIPDWAKTLSLVDRQQKALQFIKTVVEKYRDESVIEAWQVENEPMVGWFGDNCDPPDKEFLQKEIDLVKTLDPKRSIIVTDTGEWSLWKDAMQASDILGISLYRKAHSPQFGYQTYPIPSFFYPLKSQVIRKLYTPTNTKTIISELQAEPWTQKAIPDTTISEQMKLFTLKEFKNNTNYAQNTGFDEIYFWGVEWWYWMAQSGYPEYLDYAKKEIFK